MEAPDFALPPGTLIGNYKLLKVLGRGGFGITYIAWDNQLRRNIVLKECFPLGLCSRDSKTGEIIPLPHTSGQAYRAAMDSLRKEAQTLASLNHERIVRVYDVFESHGSIFYVMPWLEGGSLRERMDEAANGNSTMTTGQTAKWLLLLLDGLDYLHGKGIYHRDIKPGNILFDERGLPVLIDFGAALNKPEVTCTITQGEFSYAYASPEQITGKGEIGPWTDLYALAATWYELISGIPVEPADRRLMQDDVVPLSSMTFSTPWPQVLLNSIDKNLQLQPAKRCQTAGEWSSFLFSKKHLTLLPAKKWLLYGLGSALLIASVFSFLPEKTESISIPPKGIPDAVDLEDTPGPSLPKIEISSQLPPSLSKEAMALQPKVLLRFRWTEQEKTLRSHLDKVSLDAENFKEFIHQEVVARKQRIDSLKLPPQIMEEIIVDSQKKYYSPIWYNSDLLKTFQNSWERANQQVSTMIADIAQWESRYPSVTPHERTLVQEIVFHQKRKLSMNRTGLNNLKKSVSEFIEASEKKITDYAYSTGRRYYALPAVTEEWQAREKYKIDDILSSLEKSRQNVIQQASEQINKKKLFFKKIDDIVTSFKNRQDLLKWSKGEDIRQLEQEGKALDAEYDRISKTEQEYREQGNYYAQSFSRINTLVPENEVRWTDDFSQEIFRTINGWPTKGLKGWEQNASAYPWRKVHGMFKTP